LHLTRAGSALCTSSFLAGAFFHTFFRVYSPIEFAKKYDKVRYDPYDPYFDPPLGHGCIGRVGRCAGLRQWRIVAAGREVHQTLPARAEGYAREVHIRTMDGKIVPSTYALRPSPVRIWRFC
jgi:hypothetical protein